MNSSLQKLCVVFAGDPTLETFSGNIIRFMQMPNIQIMVTDIKQLSTYPSVQH